MKIHHLKLSDKFCATGLKYIECPHCDYLVIAEVDSTGRIFHKEKINSGQRNITHMYTEKQDTQKV